MPQVAVPSRNRAAVSLAPRPQRRCTAIDSAVPNGRAMKANEKITNAHSMPSSSLSNGKNTLGNTSTQAMPKTKKSKYSEARPMTTPTAISPGATCEWLAPPEEPGWGVAGA